MSLHFLSKRLTREPQVAYHSDVTAACLTKIVWVSHCSGGQDIGGPAEGEDSDDFVLDLEDFSELDDTLTAQILSLIVHACATNVVISITTESAACDPTAVTCNPVGETCEASGECLFRVKFCQQMCHPGDS